MKNTKGISSVGIVLILYITLWSCNNNPIILYGGYGLLMFLSISKLFFSEGGATIKMYTPLRQLFLFMCYCTLSIFWAYNQDLANEKIMFIIPCVLMVIVTTNYFVRTKDVNSLIITVAVMGIILAFYVVIKEGGLSALYSKATSSIGEANLHKSRVGGEINNVNFIGMQCGYSTIVLFYYALCEKKKICYFLLIIPLVVTIASGSRKALLVLGIGLILIYYYHQREQKSIEKYLKILLVTLVGYFVLRYVLSLDIMYTLTNRVSIFFEEMFSENSGTADGSSRMRWNMIVVGLKQFLSDPALGIGLGNSVVLNASALNFPAYSHNDYIEHLVNGGLIGFLLYYRIFIYFIKEYKKYIKTDDDPKLRISYVLMILVLVTNIGMVSYYNSMQMYLFFILWSTQIQIKKEEGVIDGIHEEGYRQISKNRNV